MYKHAQNTGNSRDEEALFQAVEQEGCPICLVTLEAMKRVMDSWQYEVFSDAENRQVLVRSLGFCPRHTWQLAHYPVAFQLALVYHDTLSEILANVKQRPQRSPVPKRGWFWAKIRRSWRGSRQKSAEIGLVTVCSFCQRQSEVEARLVSTAIEMIASEQFRQGLSQTGFCLLHFTQATHIAKNEEQRAILQKCQYGYMQRLHEDLAEQLRKHDYRFLKEPRGNEMIAWQRAAELFAGNAGAR